ncbi:HAD family hydrolase [Clostridiaceae bacterium UIB06]|nr:HAD family hydrolase [Clostridiaceae bacterium UIB06]
MIKLVASDMDGTLLNECDKLNEETFDIIMQLKEKGILFAVASGRQYFNIKNKFSEIKENIIYVVENGSYVILEGEELYSSKLDRNMVNSFIETTKQIEGCEMVLCGKKGAYVEKSYEEFIKQVERYYLKYEIVNDFSEVEDDILKFTIYDFKGASENCNKVIEPLFGNDFQVTVSGENWLDIINDDVNKGVAIKYLQEKLNIKPEETMVFGDYFNDLSMFESAYYSYAMENAPDEVKEHARFIAKSNRENGVLEVIKNELL